MGKHDDLIAKWADEIKKCNMRPEMDCLKKVIFGFGPSICNADTSTVAGNLPAELETVKKNFLVKKLGLPYGTNLLGVIGSAIETYGKSEHYE